MKKIAPAFIPLPASENSNTVSISRRNLIKTIALGSAGLILSPHTLLSATRKQKDRLGVALVGLGYYSTDLLAPALQQTKRCYLAGIVTGTPSKAETWKAKYNIPDKNIYNYQNFDQIANNPDIDVVYVVLPPSMHHEYTIRAANAGKHVWCEKPMAMTAKECQEMIDACKKNKKTLAIGYRLQHEPNTQEWRRIVNNKLLGKVKSLNCAAGYRDNRTDHWKQKKEMGGGVLYDMGVYSIQGARLGTGMEPIAIISAQTSTTRPEIYKNGLDETTVAKLEFPGGVMADIKTSFGENINELHIKCEKGDINMSPYQSYAGLSGSSPLGEIHFPYSVPWQQAKQMDDDAVAIMQNKPLLVPGEEGLRDIRIVEAIYKSAATGQRVNLL
ncbi:Gfo/Idh/MocA family oxidoreductase [Chitinophagaceae bacterium LB-8]|uniref:Gfo/Idh/MocA family oxidoreductase n=1 Tax=Paraflavisolibacter caeni TaxID=2982496 RepID=A0A9X3BGC8_9BACT|nr:Gfo/Idh/MocA family oxidoreductase [Paraflavisolibacter caeni]MCU7547552.1 Gfo/Idh/MocA family oxidoreductase [Paraflavisolibacter caeni]